ISDEPRHWFLCKLAHIIRRGYWILWIHALERPMTGQPPRRPSSAKDKAEALFKKATTRPAAEAPMRALLPTGREAVSIRVDRDVLAHFQEGGPGWQDRLNAALRKAAGLE